MNLSELDPAIRRALLHRLVFPSIFQGRYALTVDNGAYDPDALWHKCPPLDGFVLKWGGTDSGSREEYKHNFQWFKSHGLYVGVWLTDEDFPNPPDMVQQVIAATIMTYPRQPDFVVYDVELWYKRNGGDRGDGFWRASSLVEAHATLVPQLPAATTSYGKADTEMDLDTLMLGLASADGLGYAWPMIAQGYDAFTPTDAVSYAAEPGWWPVSAIVPMVKSLRPAPGQWIYRPESLDG